VARIDKFLELWPGADFGPGHIVLGDCNIDDRSMRYCLEACRTWDPNDEDFSAEEIAATVEFLESLLAIPEDDRLQPGDWLCSGGK
jgi:hypothetical protein